MRAVSEINRDHKDRGTILIETYHVHKFTNTFSHISRLGMFCSTVLHLRHDSFTFSLAANFLLPPHVVVVVDFPLALMFAADYKYA